MERRVQIHRLGVGHQLRVHRLHEVGAAQVEQVVGVRLDQSLFELGEGKRGKFGSRWLARHRAAMNTLLSWNRSWGGLPAASARTVAAKTGRSNGSEGCGSGSAAVAGVRCRQPVPHHLAPHGVGTGGRQPGLEQRELLDEFLFRQALGPHELTQDRTQQAVERRLLGEAEPLACDRFEHLVDRRTSPGGEPVLPLENEGGQFVPAIQLGRRVAESPAAFGNRYLAITVDQFVRDGSSATPRNRIARSRPASVRANVFRLPFVRKPAEASSLRKSSNSAADSSEPSSLPTSFRTTDGATGFLLGRVIRISTRSATAVSVAAGY